MCEYLEVGSGGRRGRGRRAWKWVALWMGLVMAGAMGCGDDGGGASTDESPVFGPAGDGDGSAGAPGDGDMPGGPMNSPPGMPMDGPANMNMMMDPGGPQPWDGDNDFAGLGPEPSLPPVSDYREPGPFKVLIETKTGPDGNYTLFRPEVMGPNGFVHPIATWGNGILTMPNIYKGLLGRIASHGFVLIGSDSTRVTPALMTAGLDWLIEQNDAPGPLQGKLDTERAASVGYSLGGRGAVNAGAHPSVVVTVAMHGLTGASNQLHGPLLLFAGELDDVVTPGGFVQPTFDASTVPTFYTTLAGADHLVPLNDAKAELAPTIAWLRLWVYGDEGARAFFYGDDCTLCAEPWLNTQRKNWE